MSGGGAAQAAQVAYANGFPTTGGPPMTLAQIVAQPAWPTGLPIYASDFGNAAFINVGTAAVPNLRPVSGMLLRTLSGFSASNFLLSAVGDAGKGFGISGVTGCVLAIVVQQSPTSGYNEWIYTVQDATGTIGHGLETLDVAGPPRLRKVAWYLPQATLINAVVTDPSVTGEWGGRLVGRPNIMGFALGAPGTIFANGTAKGAGGNSTGMTETSVRVCIGGYYAGTVSNPLTSHLWAGLLIAQFVPTEMQLWSWNATLKADVEQGLKSIVQANSGMACYRAMDLSGGSIAAITNGIAGSTCPNVVLNGALTTTSLLLPAA